MRILIAEDDEALARFVRQGLESEHYSVDVLPNQLELRRRRSTTMSSFTA
jgi:DNA-binding response OmpR family regulator